MKDFAFSKSMRLLKPAEFDRVFRDRCSSSDRLLVVYVAPGQSELTRVGLVVSRKCGNAVTRNRWKRLLREAFRLEQHRLPSACDVVVIPKTHEVPTLEALRKSLPAVVKRAADKMQLRSVAAEGAR